VLNTISSQAIDRWLKFNLFNKNIVFEVNLSDCIDEFGNTFGLGGTHPFIGLIKNNNGVEYLKRWYSDVDNQIHSYCFSENSNFYFCPWEFERVRPIKKFLPSHKIGPTPDKYIDNIVRRLESIYESIVESGYASGRTPYSLLRVIEISDGSIKKYIVRDGQHRAAVLSALGFNKVKVCFEADYFKVTFLFKCVYLIAKLKKYSEPTHLMKSVSLENVDDWPHVKSGFVSKEDALIHFKRIFYK
jgi:hypothetical protein